MSNDVAQAVFFTVVGAAAALGLWWIFIEAPKARLKQMTAWAQKRSLRFIPPVFLGSSRQGVEVSTLEGSVGGVPFQLRSHALVNTRRAGVNGFTDVSLRPMVPSPVVFTLSFRTGPSVHAPDAVWTGDAGFTGLVRTHSDDVAAARAWLTAPALKQAIAAPITSLDSPSMTIAVSPTEVRIRLEAPIWNEPFLDRVLAVVAAAAHARLA